MIEIREITNSNDYNPLSIDKNASFTQAWFYGEWQEAMGRKVGRFAILNNSEAVGFFQFIKYLLPFGQNIIYIPHAPLLRSAKRDYEWRAEFLKTFHDKLVEIAKAENAIFVRFDFFGDEKILDEHFTRVPSYGYRSVYFQPKYEWVLGINKPESELLNDMSQKGRYDIRLAENKGVTVKIVDSGLCEYFEDFYGLLSKTAKRNNFSLHPKSYYRNIFADCEKNKNAFLTLAKYDNKFFATHLLLIFGETAYSIFGGFDDAFKQLRASRLLHWRGIIEAKNRGCKFYNFGGISSGDNYESYKGITEFKKSFGGQVMAHQDSHDLILKPIWYRLYNLRKWASNRK